MPIEIFPKQVCNHNSGQKLARNMIFSSTSKSPVLRFSPTVMEAACTGLRVENATALLPSPSREQTKGCGEHVPRYNPGFQTLLPSCSPHLPRALHVPRRRGWLQLPSVRSLDPPHSSQLRWAWRVLEAAPLAQGRTLPQAGSAPSPGGAGSPQPQWVLSSSGDGPDLQVAWRGQPCDVTPSLWDVTPSSGRVSDLRRRTAASAARSWGGTHTGGLRRASRRVRGKERPTGRARAFPWHRLHLHGFPNPPHLPVLTRQSQISAPCFFLSLSKAFSQTAMKQAFPFCPSSCVVR